jgi:hypothetical protein
MGKNDNGGQASDTPTPAAGFAFQQMVDAFDAEGQIMQGASMIMAGIKDGLIALAKKKKLNKSAVKK